MTRGDFTRDRVDPAAWRGLFTLFVVVALLVGGAMGLIVYGGGHGLCQLEGAASGEAGPFRFRPFRGCERFDVYADGWVALPPAPEAL